MPSRDLPARPDLTHLKREARALHEAFERGDASAADRVRAVLGRRTSLRRTEALRVIAREYGFRGWPALRAHVLAARGDAEAIDAFFNAISNGDRAGALAILRAAPGLEMRSLHVAAALGDAANVRALLANDPAAVHRRVGAFSADPLLWLCHSPFHGESAERDRGLLASARALLDAGADPNTRDGRWGVPPLYGVTGLNHVPAIARMLLEAGANPTDGESVFHAAERYNEEALALLLEWGVDLNAAGDWGNTALWFLLRYHDLADEPRVRLGFEWLLAHGADPDVRSSRDRETALHVAARRGQDLDTIDALLRHGADPNARRGDGRTPWALAMRAGFTAVAERLAAAGAEAHALAGPDALLAACGRGDSDTARALATTAVRNELKPDDLQLLPEAAAQARERVVQACIAAGFPIDTADSSGATALHVAAIRGDAALVRFLLQHGADFRIEDPEHHAPAIGWACFGSDHVAEPGGDYVATVRALLDAGARLPDGAHPPQHEGVRRVLAEYGRPS